MQWYTCSAADLQLPSISFASVHHFLQFVSSHNITPSLECSSQSLSYHYQPASSSQRPPSPRSRRSPTTNCAAVHGRAQPPHARTPTPLSRRGGRPPCTRLRSLSLSPAQPPPTSDTMPAPKWFQKLRRRRKGKQQQGAACGGQQAADADADADAATTSAARVDNRPSAACAVSPNRASYYFATADRSRQDRELPCVADMALDVRVDVVHRRAGERRLGGLDAPPGTPELKLRRIVTRPAAAGADASESGGCGGFSSASATTSAATTPSTRARGFHVRTAGGRRRHRRRRHDHDHDHDHDSISANKKGKAALTEAEAETEASPLRPHGSARRRRWLYESLVVVKSSSDPEREMAESMAEMVVANGIRSSDDLEELLACYLALNAAEHHRAVVAAFRHVWSLLARHSLLL